MSLQSKEFHDLSTEDFLKEQAKLMASFEKKTPSTGRGRGRGRGKKISKSVPRQTRSSGIRIEELSEDTPVSNPVILTSLFDNEDEDEDIEDQL